MYYIISLLTAANVCYCMLTVHTGHHGGEDDEESAGRSEAGHGGSVHPEGGQTG